METKDKETTIIAMSREIRNFLHNSSIQRTEIFRLKDKEYWNQLWVCLDTLEDTETAISSFEKIENIQSPNEYLNVYGLLQLLFVQQDSVNNLKESLGMGTVDWFKEYPSLHKIRQVRNEATGHPTKNRAGKYCVIQQHSITKDGFRLGEWSKEGFKDRYIEFSSLLSDQSKSLKAMLQSILQKLIEKEIKHKKKFAGEKLAEKIPDSEVYSFGLLRQLAFKDGLAWHVFDGYQKSYTEIKEGLEKRYGLLSETLRIPGTLEVIKLTDHIFERLEKLRGSVKTNQLEIEIYTDALIKHLTELREHLLEVDEEFSTD